MKSYLNLYLYLLVVCLWPAGCRPEPPGDRSHQISETTTHGGAAPAEKNEPGPDLLRQFTLAPGQAGPVRLGMTVQELKASVPVEMLVEKEVNREGQLYTVYEVLNDTFTQETGLVAEPLCDPECRIYRIEVRDRKYQTDAGLGIGSTYGEVRQALPITYASAEAGNLVAVSAERGLSFLLDHSSFSGPELGNVKKENIPDSTLVTGILLVEPSK